MFLNTVQMLFIVFIDRIIQNILFYSPFVYLHSFLVLRGCLIDEIFDPFYVIFSSNACSILELRLLFLYLMEFN